MIKHDNIIYVRDISKIGGVETYVYELVKKYHNLDIAVVCRTCDATQRKRLKKYCPVYMFHNEPIECKVAIINYDTTIIDYLPERIWRENLKKDSKEGIYQGVHADYTHPAMGPLPQDPRIKAYLAITEDIIHKWPLMTDSTNVQLCRNPLEIEDSDALIIVSPTRLTKQKGGDLMLAIANELDRQEIPFVWFVLTTDEYLDNPIFLNKNVVWVKNRLDVSPFLKMADWVVLPSMCEGDSYTIREALYRGIPIVARKLPYFDEYSIKDGKNALFVDDFNVEQVAKRMKKRLKFTFEPIKDGYEELFIKSKSHYKPDLKNITLKYVHWVPFTCTQEGVTLGEGDTITVSDDRAEELLGFKGCFEVVKG
jgi:glycosyltransferase involved in cell wall biosynthesis